MTKVLPHKVMVIVNTQRVGARPDAPPDALVLQQAQVGDAAEVPPQLVVVVVARHGWLAGARRVRPSPHLLAVLHVACGARASKWCGWLQLHGAHDSAVRRPRDTLV